MKYQFIWICERSDCNFKVDDTTPRLEYLIADHPHPLVKCKNLNYNIGEE